MSAYFTNKSTEILLKGTLDKVVNVLNVSFRVLEKFVISFQITSGSLFGYFNTNKWPNTLFDNNWNYSFCHCNIFCVCDKTLTI